jgi:hypothetical protein
MVDKEKGKTLAEQAGEQKKLLMYICPLCGKTVDMSRRYCNCHANLREATVMESADLLEVKPCNFESPGLNCSDCPEDCMYCASFGEPETNRAGFGGQDCRHKITGKAKCYCCKSQAELALNLGTVSFSQLAREVMEKRRAEGKAEEGKNVFLKAAEIIREQMEKPILDQIKQKWERERL